MKNMKSYLILFATGLLITAACSSKSQSDTNDVTQMNSVSNNLEKSNEELTAKAKQVEESLEKIDKELTSTKQHYEN